MKEELSNPQAAKTHKKVQTIPNHITVKLLKIKYIKLSEMKDKDTFLKAVKEKRIIFTEAIDFVTETVKVRSKSVKWQF